MKKIALPLVIGVCVLLILIIGSGFFLYRTRAKKLSSEIESSKQVEPKKKKISEPINAIPQAERPYLSISSKDSKNIIITVHALKKKANQLNYEIEYQTETNLEGAAAQILLDTLPISSKDILLGTCSAGGACRYHKEVKGGTLLAKFTGENAYTVKSDWKYIENLTREKTLTSKDGKFQVSSPDLAKLATAIIYNSPGYPSTPNGTVISDVYSFTTLTPLKSKATITIRTNEESANAQVLGWDGNAWRSFPTTTEGKSATAEADILPLYLVVKP